MIVNLPSARSAIRSATASGQAQSRFAARHRRGLDGEAADRAKIRLPRDALSPDTVRKIGYQFFHMIDLPRPGTPPARPLADPFGLPAPQGAAARRAWPVGVYWQYAPQARRGCVRAS